MRGSRGRRRGRRKSKAARSKRSSASSSSSSKSSKSKSKKRSTAASKRKKVRSVAKAKRAATRAAKGQTSSSSNSKSTGGSTGRSRHTRGGQHEANKGQNEKAKKTVSRAFRPLAAAAATHLANSQYNNQLKQANWTQRDMSKLTPQRQTHYERLSKITGRDYSQRIPGLRVNLSADSLARFGKFQDAGWYKGLTKAFPGIKSLRINKQLYSNPVKKGWHSSQRMGRGHGLKNIPIRDIPMRDTMMRPEDYRRQNENKAAERQFEYDKREYEMSKSKMGPQQDWLSQLYSSHNISGGKLDREARDYWSNEAKTKGRDAVMQSIIGTSKSQGTYGGRKEKKSLNLQAKGSKRRMGSLLSNTIAAAMAARG